MTNDYDLQTVDEVLLEMQADGYTEYLIDGVVHSAVTTIQGDSYLGKTFLALDIARSLITGDPFLGRAVVRQVDRVAFLSTDPGGKYEMAQRVRDAGIDRKRIVLKSFYAPNDWAGWTTVMTGLQTLGAGVAIVVDNTTDLAIDANGPREVKLITDGLRLWSDNGLSVINIHHLNKGSSWGGKSGFGSIIWRKWSRVELSLTGREKSPYRKLSALPNNAPATDWGLIFDPASSPAFTAQTETATAQRERSRDIQTLNRNQKIAQWVVDNCQGIASKSEIGRRLEAKFGGSAAWHRQGIGKRYPVRSDGSGRWQMAN